MMSAKAADAASLASIPWWKKRSAQNVFLVFVVVAGVYGLIYWDVVSRAKEAYQEGEKFMRWHERPDEKKMFFEEKLQKEKTVLESKREKGKITQDEYFQKLDVLTFDANFALEESSLKYAYQWYKDTYELFSPPESKWVKLAREKAPRALAMWKAELRSKNIPFEDYMFE